WGDFISAGILLVLLFHTHMLSFVVACAAVAGLLPFLRGVRQRAGKILVMGTIVALGVIPWAIATGFLHQAVNIPPARSLLSYPGDLFIYPVSKISDAWPALAGFVWVIAVWLLRRKLPQRLVRPIAEAKGPILFL